MTKDEYLQKVHGAASTFLLQTNAEESEHEKFVDFYDSFDGYDKMHSLIDSVCETDWKGAVQVLGLSARDPDDVDPGLHEGCNWKKTLVCLAFEVFRWDVEEETERMFDNKEKSDVIVEFPTSERQVGYFPMTQDFEIPQYNTIDMQNGIKVYRPDIDLVVIFQGDYEKTDGGVYLVHAQRVYTQTDKGIKQALEECRNTCGVREC